MRARLPNCADESIGKGTSSEIEIPKGLIRYTYMLLFTKYNIKWLANRRTKISKRGVLNQTCPSGSRPLKRFPNSSFSFHFLPFFLSPLLFLSLFFSYYFFSFPFLSFPLFFSPLFTFLVFLFPLCLASHSFSSFL